MPREWELSTLIPIYKGKGDPMEYGVWLLQSNKVVGTWNEGTGESFGEEPEKVNIDDMQFGFMSGKGTVDAIFIARQLQEKFMEKRKDLFYAFVDLEKAFDRVPRDVVRWALRQLGVEEWLVQTVMVMYEKARTTVRTKQGSSEEFEVKVGVHQGSVLSPLLLLLLLRRKRWREETLLQTAIGRSDFHLFHSHRSLPFGKPLASILHKSRVWVTQLVMS